MTKQPRLGSIDIHNVTRDNIECTTHDHGYFGTIKISLGVSTVTLYTTVDEIAAIRRILGGW